MKDNYDCFNINPISGIIWCVLVLVNFIVSFMWVYTVVSTDDKVFGFGFCLLFWLLFSFWSYNLYCATKLIVTNMRPLHDVMELRINTALWMLVSTLITALWALPALVIAVVKYAGT
jgi:hypothetical protein